MIEFLFPRSLRRLPYFIRSVAVSCLVGLLLPIHEMNLPVFDVEYIGWLALGLGLFVYYVMYIMRPRCKDAGMSLWFLALALVPVIDGIFALCLLFARSRDLRLGQRVPV